MPSKNTERQNPLLAAGLQPKTPTPMRENEAMSTQAPAAAHPIATQIEQAQRIIQRRKSEEERATEKVTAYFTPDQYDRIEDLRRQHRKRTGKRISVNALLRRLVERATIEDLLA